MKTDVRRTSLDAYYKDVLANGKELQQVDRIVKYVITHPACTRRQIAAYFFDLDEHDPLGEEARVSARVNAALKLRINGQPVIEESDQPVRDVVTGHKAYTLWPADYGKQKPLLPELNEEARP